VSNEQAEKIREKLKSKKKAVPIFNDESDEEEKER